MNDPDQVICTPMTINTTLEREVYRTSGAVTLRLMFTWTFLPVALIGLAGFWSVPCRWVLLGCFVYFMAVRATWYYQEKQAYKKLSQLIFLEEESYVC